MSISVEEGPMPIVCTFWIVRYPLTVIIIIICDFNVGNVACTVSIFISKIKCYPPFLCIRMVLKDDIVGIDAWWRVEYAVFPQL